MSLDEKWDNEEPIKFKQTKLNDLKCRFCVFKDTDNISECEIYPVVKPDNVLLGGNCGSYVRE